MLYDKYSAVGHEPAMPLTERDKRPGRETLCETRLFNCVVPSLLGWYIVRPLADPFRFEVTVDDAPRLFYIVNEGNNGRPQMPGRVQKL